MLFCSCVFSPFSIAITSLVEERANHSAFRTFVRFVLVLFFFFSVSSSSWCLRGAAVCDCGAPWAFLLPFVFFFTFLHPVERQNLKKFFCFVFFYQI